MEEFKKALALRKEGKYEEGFEWLQKASDFGNLYAKYELDEIYRNGGWGREAHTTTYILGRGDLFYSNRFLRILDLMKVGVVHEIDYLREEARIEGVEGMVCFAISNAYKRSRNKTSSIEWLRKGAQEGCARCFLRLWEETASWDNLLMAVKQKHHRACKEMFYYYWCRDLFKQAFDNAYDCFLSIRHKGIVPLTELAKTHVANNQALYFIGRSAPASYRSESIQLAMEYYKIRHNRVQEATICWLLIAKRMRLYKDVARIIGKMVFESREYEGIWDEGDNWKVRSKKRIKK